MEKTLIRLQMMIGLLVCTILLGCNCPDRVEPTLDFTITPREPKFGDTVEFTDLSNASKLIMIIEVDSISALSPDIPTVVNFKQDGSLGKITFDSIFNKSRFEWDYPSKGGNYNYDFTNRFRTRFVINKKVSKLIVFRIARNYANECDGNSAIGVYEGKKIEVIKYDTIYVRAN